MLPKSLALKGVVTYLYVLYFFVISLYISLALSFQVAKAGLVVDMLVSSSFVDAQVHSWIHFSAR